MPPTTRRQFCEQTVLGVGAWTALCGIGCRPHSAKQTQPTPDASAPAPPPRTFSAAAFATLSAVCEQLLPRDQDPGALDLGVPAFIDAMVATPELASVREMLLKVLPIIDKESRKRFGGKAFPEASSAERDSVLESWQNGSESRQHFFDVILSLTFEGAFGDPKYGGNTGGRGFSMIGFSPDVPLKKMPAMHHDSTPG
jgi:gluconate 2-dehydrogenase gamma chain